MFYNHQSEYCFSTGLTPESVSEIAEKLMPAMRALASGANAAAKPVIDIASKQDDLSTIRKVADEITSQFEHVVIAGAGGSGLSGSVLTCLNPVSKPALHFLENIDPNAIDDIFARIDVEKSFFIIISKSGSTVETVGHFYALLEHVKAAVGSQKMGGHFLIITMPGDNPLRRGAADHNIRCMDHESAIGGRFSVFTNVGLLPAAIAGLDIARIRKGAQSVVEALKKSPDAASFSPAYGAALQYAFIQQGKNISVMLPYAKRLNGFSRWYRQSWAESLGKSGKGSTPIRAVGTTDQHSQLQLYLDGPKDKLFHLITLRREGTGQKLSIPTQLGLTYLEGKTTGDIMAAEQKATMESLISHRCPVRLFTLERLAEEELGALLMHFILEIVLMGELLSVNPFDQPAVEESKRFAREYLGSQTP